MTAIYSYLPRILSHLSISLDTVVLVVETHTLSKLLISQPLNTFLILSVLMKLNFGVYTRTLILFVSAIFLPSTEKLLPSKSVYYHYGFASYQILSIAVNRLISSC